MTDDLETALVSVLAEEAPASDEEIAASLAAVVGLIGQDWPMGRRDEFIALATLELSTYPGAMVLNALQRARRRVTAGRLLVAWVAEDVEPKAAALRVERDRLVRLSNLAVPVA